MTGYSCYAVLFKNQTRVFDVLCLEARRAPVYNGAQVVNGGGVSR